MRGVGRAAAVAVGAATLAYLLSTLVLPVQAAISAEAGRQLDSDLLHTAQMLDLAGAPYLVALVVAGVLVIIWTWRVRKNLEAFPGAGPAFAAGWAIAGWLVPFANFFMPYRVVANVARDTLWRLTTPWLVKLWWGAWLLFGLADGFVAGIIEEEWAALPAAPVTSADFDAYADHYISALGSYLIPTAACLAAGVSLIWLIIRISAAQEARIARTLPAGPILPGATLPTPTP
ncbi:DUF4328 domain-containing protein [Micromonospora thermarum]|uniref:DUF4328 domain-containing protein n=1 Tax=Micromonospora thermarum TaxID=2720024 RepID=A0ABX0ZIT7_9ACTN|nr:DUF4328 domain-containing protein [Micromonospora thermarum]NJP35745.1 DUF4328 domain-containing protein [Micromonospora thermarum]